MGHVLALVPARAGSKGIPDKNIRPLVGHTLLHYAAQAALASGVVDRSVLSTDSERVADEGRRAGLDVPFIRPAALAQDDTPMLPVIEHAVTALTASGWEPEMVVLLQPTSPLRTGAHIRAAVQALRDTGADSVVTVVEVPRHLSPDYVMRIDADRLVPFLAEGSRITRRQDTRPAFVRDGTAYVFWTKTLRETHSIYGHHCHPLVIPADESITIDTPGDWDAAERRLAAIPRQR
jgi:CMP-N,N'-diacetyllegionaminic acid synthase